MAEEGAEGSPRDSPITPLPFDTICSFADLDAINAHLNAIRFTRTLRSSQLPSLEASPSPLPAIERGSNQSQASNVIEFPSFTPIRNQDVNFAQLHFKLIEFHIKAVGSTSQSYEALLKELGIRSIIIPPAFIDLYRVQNTPEFASLFRPFYFNNKVAEEKLPDLLGLLNSDVLLNDIVTRNFQLHAAYPNLKSWSRIAPRSGPWPYNSWMSFGTVDNSHNDIVLAVDFDYYGDRMVTASSDHKLRVWDRKGDDWALLDTWKAHEAEIVDVKWNGPFWGSTLASVGEDGRVKLFQEDPLEIPKSGRRFKVIWWQRSETNIPFMSLDFKNLPTENLLALTTRDGYIQVLEPTNSNSLSDWSPVDAKFNRYLIKSPDRSEETGFCVTFHKEEMPSFAASVESYEHKPISLAVATMKKVKVFRTDSQRRFYLAAELEGARQVIRDIAWANGSIRGKDVIATASKDGYIRIYEVQLEKAINNPDSQFATQEDEWKDLEVVPDSSAVSRTQQSQITAGLHKIKEDYAPQRSDPVVDRPREIVTLAAELTSYSGAVWRLAFSPNGDVLASTGDNGAVRSWKKSLSGQWLEYAQVDVEGDT